MSAAKRCIGLVLVLLATMTASAGAAVVGLYGTGLTTAGGLNAAGNVDANYTLNGGKVYVSDPTVYPISDGSWVGNTKTSQWISPAKDPGTTEPTTTYTYQTTFTATNVNLNSLTINGSVAADDIVSIKLNGSTIYNQIGGYTSWTSFILNSSNSSFLNGTNTLSFIVNNSGGGPTGLQVQIQSVSYLPTTPEPGAISLLVGAGLPAAGVALRRRRRARR